ncbi:MAG: DUF4340 domain-containing protein [Nitrospirales bacterium]|nr:DUF4340 domain-containing protein [Nitrospirales bacterium]
MKKTTLLLLATVTATLVLAIVLLSNRQEIELSQPTPQVFPKLLDAINTVATIHIATQAGTITVIRDGNHWNVKEKFGYAADRGKVREALLGLADLRLYEPKTKNPELYERLDLLDVEAEGSTSTFVQLKTAEETSLAELIIGKQHVAKGNPRQDEIYIRKPQDPQAWLALGKLQIIQSADKWLDTAITNIDEKRIHRVRILHADGTSLTIEKDTPSATDFKVLHLPEGATIAAPFNVNNIASTLADLSFDDIHPASENIVSTTVQNTAILETFDGLQVTIKTTAQDGQHYLRGSAAYKPELRQEIELEQKESDKKENESAKTETAEMNQPPKVPPKSPEEVEEEASVLMNKLQNWVFVIPRFKVENFSKHLDDLLEKIP